jgi:hypothetical protein
MVIRSHAVLFASLASIAMASGAMASGAMASGALAQSGPMSPSDSVRFRAIVIAAQGQVSIDRDNRPWAITQGENVPIQRTITTGRDGYARFEVQGGSNFELYANSRVIFRQNPGYSGDLLDVVSGHVRVHLGMAAGSAPERIHCRSAIIVTHEPTTVAIATDEDGAVRLDVLEGEVSLRHALHPNSAPVIVRAIDAIVIRPDEQISHRVERGTLYRYTIQPIRDLLEALTPGHAPKVREQPLFSLTRRYNEGACGHSIGGASPPY